MKIAGKIIFGLTILFFTMLASFSCSQKPNTTEEKNLAVMKRFYDEMVNKGNIELFDELTSEDFIEHEDLPGFPKNREGVKQFFAMFRTAFPDLLFTVEDMAASGDKVWTYFTVTGTHKGDFMDIPATGNKIEVKAFDMVRFVNGKATEHWGVFDTMTMMHQLGVIPGMN